MGDITMATMHKAAGTKHVCLFCLIEALPSNVKVVCRLYDRIIRKISLWQPHCTAYNVIIPVYMYEPS